MKIESRLVIVFVLRLLMIAAAVWVAISAQALPPGTHWVLRAALAAMFLVVSVLIGEVATLRTQFELFLRALRSAGVQVSMDEPASRDKEAIAILIRALGSREPSTREKAYKNLVRLTGQQLPPEKAAWEAWWKAEKEGAPKSPEQGS